MPSEFLFQMREWLEEPFIKAENIKKWARSKGNVNYILNNQFITQNQSLRWRYLLKDRSAELLSKCLAILGTSLNSSYFYFQQVKLLNISFQKERNKKKTHGVKRKLISFLQRQCEGSCSRNLGVKAPMRVAVKMLRRKEESW